jgi:hypothetical protein
MKILSDQTSKLLDALCSQAVDLFNTSGRPTRDLTSEVIQRAIGLVGDDLRRAVRQELRHVLLSPEERRLVELLGTCSDEFHLLLGGSTFEPGSAAEADFCAFQDLVEQLQRMVLSRVGMRSLRRGDGK